MGRAPASAFRNGSRGRGRHRIDTRGRMARRKARGEVFQIAEELRPLLPLLPRELSRPRPRTEKGEAVGKEARTRGGRREPANRRVTPTDRRTTPPRRKRSRFPAPPKSCPSRRRAG